ncbi:hypothetical protein [Photobacterium galatheae]|uniref:Lipoprotein n=1 Tax=Photobacterium galatheae TaxID=1654360 RepID=A0A066RQY6_9GAMM|nr:hypothetical protein [Photobacterium galatheae]KDM89798.1 hypothetical protein EA58_20310 [Photobacterium galatheae]MCM0151449.1 hypothetical protein [Photobacterium galatheae]
MKTVNWSWPFIAIVLFSLAGCSSFGETKTIARIGNAGSLDGRYILKRIFIQDARGAWVNFGYGAVNGYSGASSDIGAISYPQYIEGFWSKGWDKSERYFKISAPIDLELAKQKIDTLRDYYVDFHDFIAALIVTVDGPRIRVFYTMNCFYEYDECTPRKSADPNGWVVPSSHGLNDVVLLFDGIGESSDTPFPGSPYDKK